MLKGIPKIISPEILKILCEMGHGDEIVISDANFPRRINSTKACEGRRNTGRGYA